MFLKRTCAYALSILAVASVTPVLAEAAPVDLSNSDTSELRALFHTPAFSHVCPLVAYGEDYTGAAEREAQIPDTRRSDASQTESAPDPVTREWSSSWKFAASDGLDDYDEVFETAEITK
jgi:hypothetical protein